MLRDMVESFRQLGTRVKESEAGATAVEYGLMVALIAAVIIAAVVFLGQETSSAFQCTASSVDTRTNACP